MLVDKRKVFKTPSIGQASKSNVGDKMISFNSSRGSFRWGNEVVYNGISGNVIKLTFKEYAIGSTWNSPPTSTQNFEYTLSTEEQPTEITVRDYRIKVLTANNNIIEFILLSGMPSLESE